MSGWFGTVALVARREFAAQVRTKSFVISNIVVLALIVGGLVLMAVIRANDEPDRLSVELSGSQPALVQAIESAAAPAQLLVDAEDGKDEESVRERAAAGETAVGLLADGDGSYTALSKEELDPGLRAVLETAIAQQALDQALAAQDVDRAALDAAAAAAALDIQVAEPADPEQGQRVAMSWVVTYILLFQILGFCTYVAMGVVEEKSSRVVELLLATIRPLQLLWGKVLGIGAVGLVQITVYGLAGVGAGLATGLLTLNGTAASVLAAAVGWFVLGYLLFAVLYAAAGSLVSRQEEVQSATMPLMLAIFTGFGASVYSINSPESAASTVLGWLPPFSVFVMPIRTATGAASAAQIAGSIALMVLVCALISLFSARIYRRSVLGTGARVSWLEAVRR
jgi:ABC-2 type transport system permease protein